MTKAKQRRGKATERQRKEMPSSAKSIKTNHEHALRVRNKAKQVWKFSQSYVRVRRQGRDSWEIQGSPLTGNLEPRGRIPSDRSDIVRSPSNDSLSHHVISLSSALGLLMALAFSVGSFISTYLGLRLTLS